MKKLLCDNDFILMEAAVVERLRRIDSTLLHPELVHALLIYDKKGRDELRRICREYIAIARSAGVPFLMCAPTWQTNHERVMKAKAPISTNSDAVHFMKALRDTEQAGQEQVKIGGMIGCKNDCYKSTERLSSEDAETFHTW